MTDEQITRLIDQALIDDQAPSIGISGGEAFLFYDRLERIVTYATSRGCRVSINTNGFWGVPRVRAENVVADLRKWGVFQIVVSTDDFHRTYVNEERVLNVIQECKKQGLRIELQYVTSRSSSRLHDFLRRNSDALTNVSLREIPVHPVGMAKSVPETDLLLEPGIPTRKCPNAILSISADGRVIPCCNTAGHLESLQVGAIEEELTEVFERYKNSPLMGLLWREGPQAFLPEAIANGYRPKTGYVDQCHLCFDLFQDAQIAEALRAMANERAFQDAYASFKQHLALEESRATRPK